MCQKLIQKVGDEAKNNILHPGYPMEVLDEQIKNIFKNKMAQQQKKRRARNIAKQKDKDLQDTLERL